MKFENQTRNPINGRSFAIRNPGTLALVAGAMAMVFSMFPATFFSCAAGKISPGEADFKVITASGSKASPKADLEDMPFTTLESDRVPVLEGAVDLGSAIETAMGASFDLKMAKEEITEAGHGRKIALDGFDFGATYSFSYLRKEQKTTFSIPGVTIAGMAPDTFSHKFGLGKPLINPSIDSSIALADLALQTAQHRFRKKSHELILSVYKGYLEILKTEELIKVYEHNIKSHEAHLDLVKNQLREGMRTQADLLRFEVELANGRFRLESAVTGHANALIALKRILGISLDSHMTVKPGVIAKWRRISDWVVSISTIVDRPQSSDEDFMSALIRVTEEDILRHQPDVRILKLAEMQAREAVRLARAGIMGSVNLSLSADMVSSDKFFEDDKVSYTGALAYEQPLFDRGSVNEKVKKAEAALARTRHGISDTLRLLKTSAMVTLNNISTAAKKVILMEKSLEQANENLRIMEERFSEGLISNVELIDNQDLSTASRANYITALYDFYLQYASFLQILGIIDHTDKRREEEHLEFWRRVRDRIDQVSSGGAELSESLDMPMPWGEPPVAGVPEAGAQKIRASKTAKLPAGKIALPVAENNLSTGGEGGNSEGVTKWSKLMEMARTRVAEGHGAEVGKKLLTPKEETTSQTSKDEANLRSAKVATDPRSSSPGEK